MTDIAEFEPFGMQPVLAVRDLDRTLAFYRDVLGFHVEFIAGDPPAHARIVADPTYAKPTIHLRFEPATGPLPETHSVGLWFHVDHGLDELFERVRARGATILEPPEDKPWGLRQFDVRDPDGYTLAICAEIR